MASPVFGAPSTSGLSVQALWRSSCLRRPPFSLVAHSRELIVESASELVKDDADNSVDDKGKRA
jgi:hypothetical protein